MHRNTLTRKMGEYKIKREAGRARQSRRLDHCQPYQPIATILAVAR